MVEPCRRGLLRLLEAGGWRIVASRFSALNQASWASFGQQESIFWPASGEHSLGDVRMGRSPVGDQHPLVQAWRIPVCKLW